MGSRREQNHSNLLHRPSLRFEQWVSVNHCGFHARMPEQVLQHGQWNPAVTSVRRKRVTERVPAEAWNAKLVTHGPELPTKQVAVAVWSSCIVREKPLGPPGPDGKPDL